MSIRVLLVDDSAVIRGLMNQALTANPDIEIVGSASNGSHAILLARELGPDVIILDIEMPVMDGITALPELLKACPGVKIIMSSTLTARNASISLQALALGAADYLAKPSAKTGSNEVTEFYREMTSKVLALGGVQYSPVQTGPRGVQTSATAPVARSATFQPAAVAPVIRMAAHELLNPFGINALAVASSTGGPQALATLFTHIRGHLQHIPIFVTQHMPPNFTTLLADQLSRAGNRPCHEAKDGEEVRPGHIYVAPGDYHMTVTKSGQSVYIATNRNPQENFCRPAADPMLRSLSAIYGAHLVLVVLTGMGQDGMEGAKDVIRHGGSVIAQDEASCVVYGMPRAIVDNQLCKAVLPLGDIGAFLIRQIER
jgi:two-component system chemotaxis response regulator CheB